MNPSTKTMVHLMLVLLSATVVAGGITNRELEGDEEHICFNGYVMDKYCINRGTLLDKNSVVTLEEPGRHSLHCLVDVTRCINSGYEMLMDPTTAGDLFGRALTLDDTGNSLVLDLGQQTGSPIYGCARCSDGGTQNEGFRATVLGVLVPSHSSKEPPLLQVTAVRSDAEPCTQEEGGQWIPERVDFGSGGGVDPVSFTDQYFYWSVVSLHGGIMVTAWGFLLPLGILSSRCLRHRDPTWFVSHRTLNMLTVLLTILGVIVAFASFGNIFRTGTTGTSYKHGALGMSVMVLSIFQAINGFLRPNCHSEEEKTSKRTIWQVLHKLVGYTTTAMAYATMYFGAELTGAQKDTFMGVWYGSFGFVGVVILLMLGDKYLLHLSDPSTVNDSTKNTAMQENDTDEGA